MVCADFKASVEPELGQVIVLARSAINCSIFSTDNVKKCGFSLEVAKASYEVLLPDTHASSTYTFVCKLFVLFFWVGAFNSLRLANPFSMIFGHY